jgi:seryl-tRNA synthetase
MSSDAGEAAEPDRSIFRDTLVSAGLLIPSGTDGIFGRSAAYEGIVSGLEGLLDRTASDEGATAVRFPPIMPRSILEESGYLSSFPDMVGSLSSFVGSDRDHRHLMAAAESGEDWASLLEPIAVALCPATCHPLYPTLRGVLPEGGRRFDVSGWCFRNEPSVDPARMQAFKQHELVYVGDADGAHAQRDRWLELAVDLLGALGLDVSVVVANDPFFGRVGQIMASSQREETLKYEIVVPIHSADYPTAITSANCHLDHFGGPFGIETVDGAVAHSCCLGVGVDRITQALFHTHGTDPGRWPAPIRAQIWP